MKISPITSICCMVLAACLPIWEVDAASLRFKQSQPDAIQDQDEGVQASDESDDDNEEQEEPGEPAVQAPQVQIAVQAPQVQTERALSSNSTKTAAPVPTVAKATTVPKAAVAKTATVREAATNSTNSTQPLHLNVRKGLPIEGPMVPLAPSPMPMPMPMPPPPPGIGDVQEFAHLLPFHPHGQQQVMMRQRCVDFLNHVLERSAYNVELVKTLMPKCKWSEAECKALEDDLVKRLPSSGGPAPAPAPAKGFIQKRSGWTKRPKGPRPDFATEGGIDDSVYGWCDTMYDMMRKKAIREMSQPGPAPAPAVVSFHMLN